MEAASSGGGRIPDFSFGLDDANYSDRTLLLEIMDEVESDDDRTHNVKRRRRNNLLMTPTADVVYDFVLAWVHKHYPDLEERREILNTHLLHLVRFPFMTTKRLTEEVQTCDDIDPEVASKIITRALVSKAAETLHQKHCLAAMEDNRQFVERAYKYPPVKMVEFEAPHQQCIVYFHLTRKEVKTSRVHPLELDVITSQSFHLGRQRLSLTAAGALCIRTNRLYLELGLKASDSANFTVKYEVALRKMPAKDFGSWATGSHTFTETERRPLLNRVLWTGFIEDGNPCFINNVLYVRVDLTLKKCFNNPCFGYDEMMVL